MGIKIIQDYLHGWQTTRRFFSVVVIAFVFNLILGLILAAPLAHSFKNHLGSSIASENIVRDFDYLWWQEFHDEAQGLEKTVEVTTLSPKGALLNNLEALVSLDQRLLSFPFSLILVFLVYLLLQTFISGGIIATYASGKSPFKAGYFFQQATVFFLRLLGIMLISGTIFFVLYQGLGRLFRWFVDYLSQTALSERPAFYVGLVTKVILFFLLFFFQMLFDYARLHLVSLNEKNPLKAIIISWKRVVANLGSALGLYYLIFTSLVIFSLLMGSWLEWLPENTPLLIILAFLINQFFIFGFIWFRCWFYASQLKFYRRLSSSV